MIAALASSTLRFSPVESVFIVLSFFISIPVFSSSLSAFTQGSYFTIRSGGKTFITFLFDCVYTWVVCLPIAFLLSSFTSLPLEWVFLCVQAADILKAVIGAVMLKSGIWANNMVSGDSPAQTQEV